MWELSLALLHAMEALSWVSEILHPKTPATKCEVEFLSWNGDHARIPDFLFCIKDMK